MTPADARADVPGMTMEEHAAEVVDDGSHGAPSMTLLEKIREYQRLGELAAFSRDEATRMDWTRIDWRLAEEIALCRSEEANPATGKKYSQTAAHEAVRSYPAHREMQKEIADKTALAELCDAKARALGMELRLIGQGMIE